MSFPRYPKYKASGVEWLGDVPQSSRHFPNAVASSSDAILADGSRREPATLGYADFAPAITAQDQIKPVIESAPGLQTKHAALQTVGI